MIQLLALTNKYRRTQKKTGCRFYNKGNGRSSGSGLPGHARLAAQTRGSVYDGRDGLGGGRGALGDRTGAFLNPLVSQISRDASKSRCSVHVVLFLDALGVAVPAAFGMRPDKAERGEVMRL